MPITRRRRANPPDQPENNNHLADQTENAAEAFAAEPVTAASNNGDDTEAPLEQAEEAPFAPMNPALPPVSNGDRVERLERQDYTPPIESGRRTARGELFRRPPVTPPPQQPAPASFASSSPPPAPTHEISLPLGNLLHLAYNPGYTGAEEARGLLLYRLSEESKAGGRARCWSCGSIAIAYDRWNTRSRTFGEVGIAYCEICGVWSVM
ncbi:MAG TPA: hypothetical protein VKV20_11040 [Ktedonobacteraceae bacterium]|jgi:hypothetical protein|nr:hypothetical protein [Ktedonobacteraceae bacterium]